ncbi:MAG TPA: SIS domain-containing protein, partial [Steroidobacteraceae bacterium]|nr:SIS domain-containing protein [Steroidobacteraceae bacterium]
MIPDTRMFREAAAAPAAVRSQLQGNRDLVERLGEVVRNMAPRVVVTCARGSSDHAATFARYLIETRTGLLASSAAPSISSVYASKADLEGVLFIAISQSGASPDLLAAAGAARDAGALVIALINAEDSPLAGTAHHAIPLRAGVETSVAATKSYIASLAAIVDLVASWTQDRELHVALEQAPEQLVLAWQLDWGAATEHLRSASSLFVIGRG